jgi:pimeloyl-ACP methyl ester carboxylesterase
MVTQTNISSGPEGHYVAANGLDIYYEEYGSGEPLILLHGGTETSKGWQPHIPFFAPHFRVIAPDSRGHGRTNNPAGELSYRLMADDVAAFIRALDLKKPLVFGYSDGGQIALEIGMRYSHLTRALIVGAAWYKFSEVYLDSLKAMGFEGPGVVDIEQMQEDDSEGWAEALKTEHFRANDPEYWQKLLKQISSMWWTPLDYGVEDFQKITEPTLILMGDRDGIIPLEEAVGMYQLIPNAELAILPNTTHMTVLAEDGLFLRIVLDFLFRYRNQEDKNEIKSAA